MKVVSRFAAGCAVAILSACRTVPESPNEIQTEVQYCSSADADSDETAEILIRNRTEGAIEFVRAELDGVELPASAASSAKALRAFSFEGIGGKARKRMSVFSPVAGARWWQFYPSPHIGTGGSAVFQLNFEEKSHPCTLKLTTGSGTELIVNLPRYSPPRRRIEFLAFSGDGRSLLLRYSKGPTPVCLSVNGRPIPFRVLEAASKGRSGALVADLSSPVREGDAVLTELEFPNGVRRFACIRAMRGICTVAPSGWDGDFKPLPELERKTYGFDDEMRVYRLPYDVACDDTRAHVHGANSRAVVAARNERGQSSPNDLCGVDFCTALYPSVWNIYSQMADAVIAKPYKLHWGVNLSRFVDEEDAFLSKVVRDVAPRPVLWVPERFRKLRELDGAEYSILAWCAMLRGVRGVRVHHWMNDSRAPFDGNPGLAEAVKRFNADFNRLRPRLERLIPAGESEDRAGRVVVLEGWCGDEGVLLLVKNQRYDVGIDPQTKRRVRPFSVSSVSNYSLSYRLPKWMSPGECVDALSGEAFAGRDENGVYKMSISELGAFRLIWIGNSQKGAKR